MRHRGILKSGCATIAAILVAVIFAAIAPGSASATSCPASTACFSNQGGGITSLGGTDPTLSLSNTGSPLQGFYFNGSSNLINPFQTNQIDITTGALVSGSLETGGQFAQGGKVTIYVNGGAYFVGSFNGPETWTVTGLVATATSNGFVYSCNGTCVYTLAGNVSSSYASGSISEVFTSSTPWTGSGKLTLQSGSGTLVVTPEPASLSLMGTGILGLGLIVRRKSRRNSANVAG